MITIQEISEFINEELSGWEPYDDDTASDLYIDWFIDCTYDEEDNLEYLPSPHSVSVGIGRVLVKSMTPYITDEVFYYECEISISLDLYPYYYDDECYRCGDTENDTVEGTVKVYLQNGELDFVDDPDLLD